MEVFILKNRERLASDFLYLSDGPSTLYSSTSILARSDTFCFHSLTRM